MGVTCRTPGANRNAHDISLKTHLVKKLPRSKLELISCNIKTDLRKSGYQVMNWIELAQKKVQWHNSVDTVMSVPVL
jgi:hypothetical protein